MFLKVVNPLKANFKIYVLTKEAKQKQKDDEEKGTERERERERGLKNLRHLHAHLVRSKISPEIWEKERDELMQNWFL